MPLPASMICLTASGASSGGSATPLPSAIAVSTELEPPLAGFLPRTADDAALVGAASLPVRPGSAADASSAADEPPTTGSTALAREPSGSGGSETGSSLVGATIVAAAATTGWS